MSKELTKEQMQAAFYLVARDFAFIFLKGESPFFGEENTGVQNMGYVRYEVAANMNDTFYWASADCETIPWSEIVEVANNCQKLQDSDAHLFLVDYAAKKRGHDPVIPKVVEKLTDFRNRYPQFAEGRQP